MEIGDLFIINKADREGAERGAYAVRSALELRTARSDWEPPVLLTVASQGEGVDEALNQIEAHLAHLEATGGLEDRRRGRAGQRLEDVLRAGLWWEFRARVGESEWRDFVERLAARVITPHGAAEALMTTARGVTEPVS